MLPVLCSQPEGKTVLIAPRTLMSLSLRAICVFLAWVRNAEEFHPIRRVQEIIPLIDNAPIWPLCLSCTTSVQLQRSSFLRLLLQFLVAFVRMSKKRHEWSFPRNTFRCIPDLSRTQIEENTCRSRMWQKSSIYLSSYQTKWPGSNCSNTEGSQKKKGEQKSNSISDHNSQSEMKPWIIRGSSSSHLGTSDPRIRKANGIIPMIIFWHVDVRDRGICISTQQSFGRRSRGEGTLTIGVFTLIQSAKINRFRENKVKRDTQDWNEINLCKSLA